MEEVKISVICTAYNHEKYIRRALDGFVMQKTNFAYEVLIHDDASTDDTANIIREYEEKYPEIIKPIYQTENQYSKGISIQKDILFPLAKGEYIAICEGDDYWTDPLKLQKQFDVMSTHPNCVACYHSGIIHDDKTGAEYVRPVISKLKKYTTEDIITEDDGLFVTSSSLIKKSVAYTTPLEFKTPGFGDIQAFIHYSTQGEIYCLPDVMSVYRWGTAGSWTERTLQNKENHLKHYLVMVELFQKMDRYYKGKYHAAFKYKEDWEILQYCLLIEDKSQLTEEPFASVYQKYLRSQKTLKMKEFLSEKFPFLVAAKHACRRIRLRGR